MIKKVVCLVCLCLIVMTACNKKVDINTNNLNELIEAYGFSGEYSEEQLRIIKDKMKSMAGTEVTFDTVITGDVKLDILSTVGGVLPLMNNMPFKESDKASIIKSREIYNIALLNKSGNNSLNYGDKVRFTGKIINLKDDMKISSTFIQKVEPNPEYVMLIISKIEILK